MHRVRAWLTRFAGLFVARRTDRELAEEIEEHLALQTADNIRAGMSPAEARRQAILKFGAVEAIKEDYRTERGVLFLETSARDFAYALRMLRKNPGFTAVTVLTLALGIGANTAMFSVIDAVLLRPLPYAHSDRILLLFGTSLDTGNFTEWHAQTTSYDRFAAVSLNTANLTVNGDSEQLMSMEVSADFFPLLGTQPAFGRAFVSSDFQAANGEVAIMSDRLWRASFNSDPNVVGRVLLLDKRPFTIVGILPADLGPLPYRNIDFLFPLRPQRAIGTEVLARLKPGVGIGAARAEAAALADRLGTNHESIYGPPIRLEKFKDHLVEDSQPVLLLLGGAVGLVLLIACANIANLQLVRFAGRKREMTVRSTLGASRARLLRQMLVEGAVLAGFGAAAGVLIARWTMTVLIASIPFHVPRIEESKIDGTVFVFALFAAVISTILFSLIPAWGASKFDVARALKQETRSGATNGGQRRLRGAFVLAEVALSTMMLAGAALLVRTFVVLRPSNPGFDPNNKLILNIRIPGASPAQRIAIIRDGLDRVNAIAGVRSVAAVSDLPLSGNSWLPKLSIDGRVVAGIDAGVLVHYRQSTTNFFSVMRMPLVAGRDFTAADDEQGAKVAIVNQTVAGRLWPDGNPIGQRITVDYPDNPIEFTVVGIVHDARIFGMAASFKPEMYVPFWQDPSSRMSFVVASDYDPERLIPAVRDALRPLGDRVTVGGFNTMAHVVYDSVGEPRFNAQLFGSLAGLAFLLAVVGIYGVVSYSVTQRTHEIGVRMALGAKPGEVVRLVVGQGLGPTVIGVVVGFATAMALTRVMSTLLFGVSGGGPMMFVGFAAVLLAITTLACYVPARRAMRVDPMVALRHE